MEREVREQPELLRANCGRYFEELRKFLGGKHYEMVVLAARGSSDHAALYARYLIEIHLGIPAVLAAPSVLTVFGTRVHYPRCLCVGISQSGAAPDVAEVLSDAREQGHATLAITNTPGSRVTQAAEWSLILETGKEESVAATKTYTASLLALFQLVRALAGNLPDPQTTLPDEGWLERTRMEAEKVAQTVVDGNPVFALSRGYSFATGQEAALKLMECALIAAKGYSVADFQHGPRALAGPKSVAVVFGKHKLELEAQGCTVIQAPAPAVEHPSHAPIGEIMFGQWLALYAARAKGLNPDDPQFIRKITETR